MSRPPAYRGPVPALCLDHVSVLRSGSVLLADVNFSVNTGEHWAVIGSNGAGKTTLMNLLAATSFPSRGKVHVLGHQLGRVDVRELRRSIGHVTPRHAPGSNLTAVEVVLTGVTGSLDLVPRHDYGPDAHQRAASLCKEFGLDAQQELRWLTMSQGERGRALIARALVTDPLLVLLDEPSTGLDLAAREQMVATITDLQQSRPGLTTVTVTHHFEELPTTTTHALLMRGGRVVGAGPVEDVLTSELVSSCFAHPVEIERRRGRWSAFSR